MKEDVAKRWAADLRKNAKKQGYGALRPKPGKYCCLGRLQVIMRKSYDPIFGYLTLDCVVAAGLRSRGPRIPRTVGREGCFTHLNDFSMLTFPQIADLIDQHWERL